jgi:hypothetical protein
MRTGIGKSLPSAASSEQQRSLTQATHILDVLIAEFRKLAEIEKAAFTVAQQAGGTYAQQVGTLPVSSSQTAAVSSLQQPDALLQQPGAMQAVGWPVPAPPSSAPPPTSYAFPNAAQGQAAQYTGHLQMGSSGAVGGGVPYGLHSALPSTGTSDPVCALTHPPFPPLFGCTHCGCCLTVTSEMNVCNYDSVPINL